MTLDEIKNMQKTLDYDYAALLKKKTTGIEALVKDMNDALVEMSQELDTLFQQDIKMSNCVNCVTHFEEDCDEGTRHLISRVYLSGTKLLKITVVFNRLPMKIVFLDGDVELHDAYDNLLDNVAAFNFLTKNGYIKEFKDVMNAKDFIVWYVNEVFYLNAVAKLESMQQRNRDKANEVISLEGDTNE